MSQRTPIEFMHKAQPQRGAKVELAKGPVHSPDPDHLSWKILVKWSQSGPWEFGCASLGHRFFAIQRQLAFAWSFYTFNCMSQRTLIELMHKALSQRGAKVELAKRPVHSLLQSLFHCATSQSNKTTAKHNQDKTTKHKQKEPNQKTQQKNTTVMGVTHPVP